MIPNGVPEATVAGQSKGSDSEKEDREEQAASTISLQRSIWPAMPHIFI